MHHNARTAACGDAVTNLANSLSYQNHIQMHGAPVILDLCGLAMAKVTLYAVTHWQSPKAF